MDAMDVFLSEIYKTYAIPELDLRVMKLPGDNLWQVMYRCCFVDVDLSSPHLYKYHVAVPIALCYGDGKSVRDKPNKTKSFKTLGSAMAWIDKNLDKVAEE
jgi:tRNA A-37 threonylcarbamoyl transferase component Bud32